MRRRVRRSVKESESGTALIDFLARHYRFKDEARWMAALCGEKVMVNGEPAGSSLLLKTDDAVFYEAPDAPEPEVDTAIGVLYEDEHLIAVNKTGNLPCHPGGCYRDNTLLALLLGRTGLSALHLVNRLDRETSGVAVAAKDTAAARVLSQQFLERTVRKCYSAVVEGDFPEQLTAAGWLVGDEHSAVRKKRRFVAGAPDAPPSGGAEWAETRFALIRRGGGLSLVNAEPATGRTHQIRATLCSLGYPVTGDKIYGVDESVFERFIHGALTVKDRGALRLGRQALHARELHLRHPVSGEPLVLTAPLPDDLRSLFSG